MTPEERSLLEETHKLAEENNEMLKSIRRSNRLSIALRIGYWVVIIAISIGAYYAITPYLDLLSSFYKTDIHSAQNAADSLKDLFGN